MAITSAAAAKGGAAAALVGLGGTGIYLTATYSDNSISIYDQKLREFLSQENNDIIFEVKKTTTSGEVDLAATDLSFSTDKTSSITAKIKVTANTEAPNNTFKQNNKAADDTALKDLKALGKKGSGWTWECSFKFEVDDANKDKQIKDDYKNRIWKSPDLGLFGLLKKDTSSYTDPNPTTDKTWTKKEIKQVKDAFIEKCGLQRGKEENKKLNSGKDEVESVKTKEISIKFKLNAGSSSLEPENMDLFNHWFADNTSKTYHTASNGG